MQDDSSDTETSSSEYESSDADEEASNLSSSYVVKSHLFVTGGSSVCDCSIQLAANTCGKRPDLGEDLATA